MQRNRRTQPKRRVRRVRNWNRILVAVDRGYSARRALEEGASMAGQLCARLALVYVVDLTETRQGELPRFNGTMASKLVAEGRQWCLKLAKSLGLQSASHFVRVGDAAVEILAVAKEWKAELIVMGNHGLTHTGGFFLGNTVETVVRDAPCPVMTVPPGIR